jgi:putative flippase GtrA
MAISRERLSEIWRYYQAGLINSAFGFGAYALLVWLGLNLFVAQLLAHLAGMGFNYLTYSRHVFRDAAPARVRFVISYAVNYLVGLATLYLCSRVIASPYLAGFASIVIVSVINYFALKHLVFHGKPA